MKPSRAHTSQTPRRPLSPISRRVFLQAAPPAVGLVMLGGCGSGSGPYADCIYCDGPGQDYQECASEYCDYFDYADGMP